MDTYRKTFYNPLTKAFGSWEITRHLSWITSKEMKLKLENRSQKKKIMFWHSKNKASRKGYKGEC